jgi:hypothetical protein
LEVEAESGAAAGPVFTGIGATEPLGLELREPRFNNRRMYMKVTTTPVADTILYDVHWTTDLIVLHSDELKPFSGNAVNTMALFVQEDDNRGPLGDDEDVSLGGYIWTPTRLIHLPTNEFGDLDRHSSRSVSWDVIRFVPTEDVFLEVNYSVRRREEELHGTLTADRVPRRDGASRFFHVETADSPEPLLGSVTLVRPCDRGAGECPKYQFNYLVSHGLQDRFTEASASDTNAAHGRSALPAGDGAVLSKPAKMSAWAADQALGEDAQAIPAAMGKPSPHRTPVKGPTQPPAQEDKLAGIVLERKSRPALLGQNPKDLQLAVETRDGLFDDLGRVNRGSFAARPQIDARSGATAPILDAIFARLS